MTRSQTDAAEWDARYTASPDSMWSGAPNGSLVTEIAGLPVGRALDVGCGEGADAIWLAQRGWQVTAIDISSVAISRARVAAKEADVDVDWACADILETPPAPHAFDLLTIQYPALLRTAGERPLRALLNAVAPGGLLLIVGHAHADPEIARQHGFDPDNYVDLADFSRLVVDDFDVETNDIRPRPSPPPGTHHADDAVLRARRRGERRAGLC
ncbi:MAG: class I SAM-dependent methyltransferase [Actinobacteria bacterium]|nr:class I SAM-dependent methyltransferase [Actinomycetota bacterium]